MKKLHSVKNILCIALIAQTFTGSVHAAFSMPSVSTSLSSWLAKPISYVKQKPIQTTLAVAGTVALCAGIYWRWNKKSVQDTRGISKFLDSDHNTFGNNNNNNNNDSSDRLINDLNDDRVFLNWVVREISCNSFRYQLDYFHRVLTGNYSDDAQAQDLVREYNCITDDKNESINRWIAKYETYVQKKILILDQQIAMLKASANR